MKKILGCAIGFFIWAVGISCVAQIPSRTNTPPSPSQPIIQGSFQPLDGVNIGQRNPGLGFFASQAAGVSLTFTNKGTTPKKGFFYSSSQYVGWTDATALGGDGFYIDVTHALLGCQIAGATVCTITSTGLNAVDLGTDTPGKVSATDLSASGAITFSGGSANKAICWKSGTSLGYCSSVVASDGSCTCN